MFEGLQGLRAEGAGFVGIMVIPSGVSREVAFTRAHLVDPSRNKPAQAHEGMGARRGRVGVIWGGWGGGPVRKEELFSPELEAGIGWNNPRDWGQVVCQVEGGGR